MNSRILVVFLSICSILYSGDGSSLKERLSRIPDAEVIEIPDLEPFSVRFRLQLKQPLDHQDEEKGNFYQKIEISHMDFDAPVVMITEGYSIGRRRYIRLADHLCANEIRVEHRYHGDSKPDSMIWQYLNIEQAALDHHRIRLLLADIYEGNWISTGFSKGGQTAIYYRYFFPDDVIATVPYDAPMNFALEESRIDDFFQKVGDAGIRKKLVSFQRISLSRKAALGEDIEKYRK